MELKAALKAAKKLLGENRYEEAIEILKDLLSDGVEDYMLFCFAALAYANNDDTSRAKALYEKAIKLDEKMPAAWQGLYKLYDSGKIVSDDRAIEVCTHLILLCDSDEKRRSTEDCRRRVYFELCRYDELQNDLGTNQSLMAKIVDRLAKKEILSTSESVLLEKVFAQVMDEVKTNAEWNLYYCKFKYKKGDQDWTNELKRFCTNHPYTDVLWIRERIIELLSIEYFCELKFDDEAFELYSKCAPSSGEVECTTGRLLKLLRDGDVSSALDVVDRLPRSSLTSLPLAYVAAHLIAETEDWEKVSQVVDWMRSQKLPEKCDIIARALKRHVFLETNNIAEAQKIQISVSHLPCAFVVDAARVALENENTIEELIEQCGSDSANEKRLRVLRALHSGRASEALSEAESLLANDQLSWRDLLLVAELYVALGKDATALLVKAAKMNPRSSRVFFVLGRALRRKNITKSKSCLERAVKIRPTNEEYVKELDEVYEETAESIDQRLAVLKSLAASKKPLWLRKKLVTLSRSKQDWDTVISELQQIVRYRPDDILSWASLAEAYSYRGNLQSSVNAYDRVLEMDPGSDYAICLIQVMMRMHNLDGAAEQCARWRTMTGRNQQLKTAVDILEAQVHLRCFASAVGKQKTDLLNQVFMLLDSVISERPRISLAYKLTADALLHAIKFREDLLESLSIPSSWSISSRLSAARLAVAFYSVALDLNRENAWAWMDLAAALLILARMDPSEQQTVKACDCLRKAMSLSESVQMRSQLWALIAEAERLKMVAKGENSMSSVALQQHYLVRALQLNKANDDAWLRLALLYYTNGAMYEAHLTVETALKYNPHLAEAWCLWALKAESEGVNHEAMDMFRHSVSIKPVAITVAKYTSFLCQTLSSKSFDPATVMIDFNKVLRLRDEFCSTDRSLLLHIGVLAELFGHYEDAVHCLESSGDDGVHLHRARMKAGVPGECREKLLGKLAELCHMSTNDLFTLLKEKEPLYRELFECLAAPEAEGLQELYKSSSATISVPLVIAAVIRFGMPLCERAVSILHDVLPRHELIDVFPTVMPEGMDNGLKYVEQDGEEPFRYSHFIAKPLWEVLKKRRDELESEATSKSPVSS
ncbi:hypothetical protein Q1695_009428 [Nippostrongylus brasiliensis]|nr:hypothetical protein Q1695_009428 [Nippostrongylus brasiliensis]